MSLASLLNLGKKESPKEEERRKPPPPPPDTPPDQPSRNFNQDDLRLVQELTELTADASREEAERRREEEERLGKVAFDEAAQIAAGLARSRKEMANPFSTGGQEFKPGTWVCDTMFGNSRPMGARSIAPAGMMWEDSAPMSMGMGMGMASPMMTAPMGMTAPMVMAAPAAAGGFGGWGGAAALGIVEPAAKRMRAAAAPAFGGGCMMGAALMPGTKEYLVAQVKAYQSSGEEQKNLWGNYVDLYLNGIRDPNKHDAATLQEFCVNHHLPPPTTWGAGQMPVAPDPMKEPLVHRIKAFQKGGPEQKEVWQAFCGATKDPARHDAAKLREFITMFNVP
mmetsp:Transcript_27636/g.79186  ORF Transcript_27636/g.79186 Transcript_27636/m.79186 type:complete len:337 (-) Transcript_27636:141-1151(-)